MQRRTRHRYQCGDAHLLRRRKTVTGVFHVNLRRWHRHPLSLHFLSRVRVRVCSGKREGGQAVCYDRAVIYMFLGVCTRLLTLANKSFPFLSFFLYSLLYLNILWLKKLLPFS